MLATKYVLGFMAALFMCVMIGCSSKIPYAKNIEQMQPQPLLANTSQASDFNLSNSRGTDNYRLGGGDLLSIKVLGAEELDRKFRISSDGTVSYPLIGALQLGGLSVQNAEDLIAKKLGTNYLQNPQVSIFIEEYASNQVSITGQVKKPDVYNLTQPRTVVQLLALAGGVTASAGEVMRIQTTQVDPNSGQQSTVVAVVNINELLSGASNLSQMYLNAGDSIYVPEAGLVFIEGAVVKPGAYPLQGDITLRKAMVLAGGAKWSAKKGEIGILRQGQSEAIRVNYEDVIKDSSKDLQIYGGDVVIVDYSLPKRSLEGVYNFLSRIINVGVGYRLD